MGKGLVDSFRDEFDIDDTWLGFEIHPETPPEGADVRNRYNPEDIAQLSEMLRRRAEELGLPYDPAPILANSALALAAAEFARDNGRFREFHHEMLSAVFARGQNIGSRDVIRETASRAGLDGAAMLKAIDQGAYVERLRESQAQGHELGVTGVPTFIINDRYAIVGAQPIETFRRVLRQAQAAS
ncbi:DsbA family oxidoreductase [Dehalogenimonas formicexedens]|uniref:DsbA family oxidoreductase n=1 Tax=Dehalogenimonas formicexedens TaxID=1839801 RepID=UPI0009FA374F|nr:DsbA family protein [Dehalogenimonas formicexedens]